VAHQLGSTSTSEEGEGTTEEVGISSTWHSGGPTADWVVYEHVSSTYPLVSISLSSNLNTHAARCPICLLTFTEEEVATPDTCHHTFCVRCLRRWSANTLTCPIDRQQFNELVIRHYPDGEMIRRDPPLEAWAWPTHHCIVLPHALHCVFCCQTTGEGSLYYCLKCTHIYHEQCLRACWQNAPDGNVTCVFCLMRCRVVPDQ
jgi:PHD and RING finger domain-containing protein 1